MTSKERIKAALNFEEVDRVPVAVFDGGVWIADHAGMSLEEILNMEDAGASLVKEYYDQLKSDIVYIGGGCFGVAVAAFGAKIDLTKVGASADMSPLSEDLDFYKTIDFSTIRETLLADPGVRAILRQTRKLKELVGEEKYVSTLTGAPFSNAGVLVGVQNLMMYLLDEEADLEPLFRVAAAITVEFNNLQLEAGADMVFLGDAVASGSLVSQNVYDEVVFPLTKRVISQLNNPEYVFLHICGNVTSRLEGLKELEIDGFSLEGVNLREALDVTYGNYSIMGNIAPYDVLACKSSEEVKKTAKELCSIAGRKGGFILAPGCDLPNKVSVENVWAMVEAADEMSMKGFE